MSSTLTRLREVLGLARPSPVDHRVLEAVPTEIGARDLIEYEGAEGDPIRAFVFRPEREPVGAVVVFHQHAGAFHLGKSEVAGLAGEPLQAFGPALAARGWLVLAPDAITFEDRRAHTTGTEPTEGDWLQHYNAMADRLVDGDILLRKVLDDAQRAVSVLADLAASDLPQEASGVGVMGHSYGGTTALYLAAVDARVRFACVSGALCSFGTRREAGTGLNMAEVVPGLRTWLRVSDLVRAIAPRDLFVVSATDDPYSADADAVIARSGTPGVAHLRVEGEHALDRERFDAIVDWVAARGAA